MKLKFLLSFFCVTSLLLSSEVNVSSAKRCLAAFFGISGCILIAESKMKEENNSESPEQIRARNKDIYNLCLKGVYPEFERNCKEAGFVEPIE